MIAEKHAAVAVASATKSVRRKERRIAIIAFVFVFGFAGIGRAVGDDFALQGEVAAANALLESQRWTEARTAFEKIVARAPDNPDVNYALGLFACDDGEWEKALRFEEKAVKYDPNHARYQYGWGAANGIAALKSGVFSKLGYAKKCLAGYRRAVELEPGSYKYRSALLNYYQQAPGFAGGDMAKAYVQAAEIKKADAERGRQAFAQLYVGEKKYDLAFRQYEEALSAAPDDYVALYNLGRLTLLSGQRLDAGFAAFRRCQELAPPDAKGAPSHANVHWRLGNLWEKKNDSERARAEYRAALVEKPDFNPAKQALEKLGERKP